MQHVQKEKKIIFFSSRLFCSSPAAESFLSLKLLINMVVLTERRKETTQRQKIQRYMQIEKTVRGK